MNASLKKYIEAARTKDYSDERIRHNLIDAGWDPNIVDDGLAEADGLIVPPPPADAAALQTPRANNMPHTQPQPVVQSLSTRGLEYIIMFIALGVTALSLGSLLHSNVNNLLGTPDGDFTAGTVSFASSALIVALPILAFLFLRLKKAEALDPSIHRDPSRKKAVQLTLIVTFLIGLGNIIFFVYNLMTGNANQDGYYGITDTRAASTTIGNLIHLLITLAIAGGIFVYYWRDEHRKNQ